MPKLTAMMIVRNEEARYLQRCLQSLSVFVDEIIILDDASTDQTVDICHRFPLVKLYQREYSLFATDEARLRYELWQRAVDNKPEWLLAIDADEFLEERAITEIPFLLKQKYFTAISFRLFDCWQSEDYYRCDGFWNPWQRGFTIYLVKYQSELSATWPSLKFHCGRLPMAYRQLPHWESDLKIKHLGWVQPEEIKKKYQRGLERDPTFQYLSKEHYESILFPPEKIVLKEWLSPF